VVGRRRERAALEEALSTSALVTLVGPPGAGKTTLARAALVERERGLFVDLAPARTRLDLLRALASAVGAALPRELAGDASPEVLEPALDRLLALRALSAPRALVVLDNGEQVIEELAWLVARWRLRGRARLLVTSREALRVTGESVLEVPPMEQPPSDATLAAALASDSVALLVARADLAPTDADAPRLASLARRLDGIPLALELAASRVKALGLEEVERRLASAGASEALDLLSLGRRDATARQATLRGAIDWSLSLLEPAELGLFAALALFRAPFTPTEAVAVRAPGSSEAAALEVLQGLCDKSLVARAGEGRLVLLQALRERAAELPRDPDAAVRLAAHYASRARRAVGELDSRRAKQALAWLRAEVDNLLAAHDAVLERASATDLEDAERETAAWLLVGVDAILQRVGPSSLHASRLDRLLAEPLPPSIELSLRLARARVHRDAGAMDACERELERALACAEPGERAIVGAELGEARLARGALEEAEVTVRAALAEGRGARSVAGEQRAAARLGLVLHARGRLDEAQVSYELALDLGARLASPTLEAAAHRDLGSLLLQRGALARARAHYAEALARAPHDDLRLEGVVRGNLGIIALEEGDLEAATSSFRRALDCLRRIGDRTYEAHLLVYAGLTQFERGSPHDARALYDVAIDVLGEVGDARMEGIARTARAVARAALGEGGAADNDLAVARRRLGGVDDPALLALLDVARAHVGLLAAEGALEARQEAVRVASEHEPLAAGSDDLRFARRALLRALPSERFVFDAGGQGFVAPDGTRIDLARRPTLARVLEALVAKRLAEPGVPATHDELVGAGWPGERVLPLAAQNRLRVAVTTLRNMGLRQVLAFRDGGHLLDPAVPAVAREG
jgi:predicted ATPase/Tfp pilus assembly protein PilF